MSKIQPLRYTDPRTMLGIELCAACDLRRDDLLATGVANVAAGLAECATIHATLDALLYRSGLFCGGAYGLAHFRASYAEPTKQMRVDGIIPDVIVCLVGEESFGDVRLCVATVKAQFRSDLCRISRCFLG